MEPHGTSRNLMEHPGTSWNIPETNGSPWNMMEGNGTSWKTLECSGTFPHVELGKFNRPLWHAPYGRIVCIMAPLEGSQ